MQEKLNAIISRMNRADFERFQLLETELVKLCIPSINPDTFTKLKEALSEVEANLRLSLKVE